MLLLLSFPKYDISTCQIKIFKIFNSLYRLGGLCESWQLAYPEFIFSRDFLFQPSETGHGFIRSNSSQPLK